MQFFKLNSSVHKWLSLFAGIQLIIWLGTGVYFNLMDPDKASGNTLRVHTDHEGSIADFELTEIGGFVTSEPMEVKLIWVQHHPYYQVVYERGEHSYHQSLSVLFDAVTGIQFKLLPEHIMELAKSSYSGLGKLSEPVLKQPPFSDYAGQKNPMWQVDVTDENGTTIYLDAVTGRIIKHVNDDSRLKELMMKLHFMDYTNTGGFNHWLIIVFAIATLMLSITGVTWLIQQYKNGHLKLNLSKATKNVSVTFVNEATTSTLKLIKRGSVLEELANTHIYLPSSCGGGGTCGKCRFKAKEQLPATPADKEHLSSEELTQGYRLGCQHRILEVDSIEVLDKCEVDSHELTVVATNFVTPFIKEVKLRVKSGKKLSYRAGAYMKFSVPAGTNTLKPNDIPERLEKYWDNYSQGEFSHRGAVRHYSIANFDTETDELVFNIRWQTAEDNKRAGIGSGYLSSLAVGETIVAQGPFSDFYASDNADTNEPSRLIFIGAGSGLAPLRSIIFEQLKKYGYAGEITLLYGARAEDDLLYHNELEILSKQHDNFSYIPTLSRPSEQWQGKLGYVQDAFETLSTQGIEPLSTEFYLCGPEQMMIEVEKMITDVGVSKQQIFKDIFSR